MAQHEDDDRRREGDTRDFVYTGPLKWWPARGHPFRWKPHQGNPECIGEYAMQTIWKHRLLLYISVVVTLILIVSLFNIHIFAREG